MLVINNNLNALNQARHVSNKPGLSSSVQRLSSGLRINPATDNASGLDPFPNLWVQAEHRRDAESRIRDVDVTESMTGLGRNQILSQAAVHMLAQANALPQAALQLIG